MTHSPGPVCKGCEDKLLQADPYLALWFHALKEIYPRTHVSWSFRNQQIQDDLFARGASHQKWPESKHNMTLEGLPHSMALDLFEINEVGAATFKPAFYVELYEWSVRVGWEIKWGGKFTTLRDYNHFYI